MMFPVWSCINNLCCLLASLQYMKMPRMVLTVYALHFAVHTVLAVPQLFSDVISIFCMLQFVYVKIKMSFFLFSFTQNNKAISFWLIGSV